MERHNLIFNCYFKLLKSITIISLVVCLTGCGAHKSAPVASIGAPPGWHRVKAGDTLYSIAVMHHKNYQAIAQLNYIPAPYSIKVGQLIRIVPITTLTRLKRPLYQRAPLKVVKPTLVAPAKYVEDKPSSASVKSWLWPVEGQVIAYFAARGGMNKGIDIVAKPGAPVKAAAAGKVVYSGSGLRGYGELIIIKHNHEYISAYAHNKKLFVNEGEIVSAGQVIAQVGNSDAKRVLLHFEIRRSGKPVDPLKYLSISN